MIRLSINSTAPEPDVLEKAVSVIRAGGVVAMPTDTLYGLAADPFNNDAVGRVFAVKGRAHDRALPLVAADLEQACAALGELPPLARTLAAHFWPGSLTLLVAAPPALARDVSAGTGRVGIRVPAHAVTRALCRACGSPLTATSANVSGRPDTNDPDEVAASLGAAVDALLDAGKTPGGPPSTIVDVTRDAPRLVRAGAVSWETIQACLNA